MNTRYDKCHLVLSYLVLFVVRIQTLINIIIISDYQDYIFHIFVV